MEEAKLAKPVGLSPQHNSELNRGDGIPAERYDELRREYEGDQLAQMTIDTFDPESELYGLTERHDAAAKAASESGDWLQEQNLFLRIEQFKKEKYGIGGKDS